LERTALPSERVRRRVASLLDQADAAAERNDWTTVRARAEAALAFDPENAEAREYLDAAARAVAEGQPQSSASVPSTAAGEAQPTVPRAPHVPQSFASGRYSVKKFLGEGGKKKVFLAHDTVLDRDVAFALIKTEGLDDTSRKRITREAQAMGRLGDHPNIVPIFDLGQERDPVSGVQQPFMVLPLMTGGDVEGLIEKAPDHRMPLERVLQIAKDTCEGLVFAHSKGIVHRDLKPGNVWLTQEGRARIGDFGLAVASDHSRLTREAMMVGTVAYMPPEQAMGGEITPRADLYSLGAMLYEMVTGRPPFLGDDDIAIIGQHINTPPVAPSWHNPKCPKPLEALIMRLLAKDPAQRHDSAADVLGALSAVDVSQASASKLQQAGMPGNPVAEGEQSRSLDSMSSGVFVGRHKEMDQLRAALEETLSGHGRMVTLVGEPGIGKTRTAQELATYAGLRRCQVLWGRCYEGGGAPPYWPWVQAIRQYVQERSPEELRRDMGSHASVIAEIVAEVKDKLPGIQPPPQLDSPEAARFRLFDSIATYLKNASRGQSLVLVLDDLHWSDKPSLLLLEFIARELANSRILLVGAYRDVELSRRHPLAITLGDLTKERLFERILLRGLQKPDVAKFIQLAAGTQPPEGLVDAVFTQTEGNPLFVTEVVRLLVQEGELRPDKRATGDRRTTTWMVRIPEGVKEVIGRRLDRLSERCNETLTIAAVIGRQFSLQQLLAVLNDPAAPAEERTSESRLLDVLEEALAARVAEELPDAVGRYQFSHALIQETLLGELSITRRVRLHARIAEALENLHGEAAPQRAAELAAHYASAEAVLGNEKLVLYSRLAGEQSLAACALEEALDHFQRGLAALKDDPMSPRKAALLAGRGAAQVALVNTAEALADLKAAFDFYDQTGDVRSAIAVARTRLVSGEGQRGMVPILRRAMELVDPDSEDGASITTYLGRVTGGPLGDYEAAIPLIDRAIDVARGIGDKSLEMRALADRAFVDIVNLQTDSMERHIRLALEIAPLVREPLAESQMRMLLSNLLSFRGDVAGAAREYGAAVQAAEKAGDRDRLSTVHLFMGSVFALRGDWAEARRLSDLSLHYSPTYSVPLGCRALIEFQTGQFEEGAAWLERFGSGYDRSPPFEAYVLFELGEIGDSRQLLDRAASIVRNYRPPQQPGASSKVFHRMALGLCVLHTGDRMAAESAYEDLKAAVPRDSPLAAISAATYLARLAALCSMHDEAERHLDEARAECETAGFRARLAWNEYHRANFLRASEDPARRKKGAAAASEALAVARELGMRPLVERILAQRKILQA
jgi:tetratricopeptide (TPR) repeat protein